MSTFTLYIVVSYGPWFIRVKVCVPSHPWSREVGMSKESPLPIKRRTVSVKTRSEEDHYVGLLAASIFDLLVGDFVKGQRGDTLPDFKGLPNGLV